LLLMVSISSAAKERATGPLARRCAPFQRDFATEASAWTKSTAERKRLAKGWPGVGVWTLSWSTPGQGTPRKRPRFAKRIRLSELWANGREPPREQPELRSMLRAARSTSWRDLLHPAGNSDAQPLMLAFESNRVAGHAGKYRGIRPGDGLQHQQRIFDGARHGPSLIERPAEVMAPVRARRRWAQSGDAATHAGLMMLRRFRCQREAYKPAWRPGPRWNRRRLLRSQVHGLSAEPISLSARARG